ncbi:MAG: PQQ-like beta-propeller repeat protein [Firmicutes bacterium]|jgi:outer membrane protein assembly factor BamB|nr:PQQ-like beta-propeller repeat protein [Bacillota bacterium]
MRLLWDNTLYAINPDGTKKWSYELDDETPSFPVIGEDGTIYVASENSGVLILSPRPAQGLVHL